MTLPETIPGDLAGIRLPEPGEDARRHSKLVRDRVLSEIRQNGPVDFARYMEIVLYEPGLGYYSCGCDKLGKTGDFITAPELSGLFTECLARQVMEILDFMGTASLIEAGPGSGVMACNLLTYLEHLGCLPKHYYLLEVSADLRKRQQHLFEQKIPHLMHMISWLDEFPRESLDAVVLGNEVLDAMPVNRIIREHNNWNELFVSSDNGRLTWLSASLSHAAGRFVEEVMDSDDSLPDGYVTEINPRISPWITALGNMINRGMLIFIDYGYPRREYFHSQRSGGTLLCHYQHHVHADPFVYPGLQDITASVDFTTLAESACMAGMQVSGYTTQAHFLLSCGLEESIQSVDHLPDQERFEIARQARILTMPGEMGERFKVMALAKNLELPLRGFQEFDQRARL